MTLVITCMLFMVAFMIRCYEVLSEEKVDNLSLALEPKYEIGCYDKFFAEELEYL